MIIGLLLLLAPVVVFLVSLPFSKWFRPNLRKVYRIVGGLLVFVGSGASIYFAMYSGDQGGIAAYFCQLTVIAVYIVFSVILAFINWILAAKGSG